MSSYEEFKKNRKKNYSDETAYDKFKKNFRSTYSYDLGEDSYDSFVKDFNSFIESAEKDFSNVGYKNASALSDKHSTSTSELRKRANQFSGYLNHIKANMPEEEYSKAKSSLDSLLFNLNQIEGSFRETANYYSRWDTEDEYKKAVKAQEEYDKQANYDTDTGQKEIDELEGILDNAYKMRQEKTGEIARDKRAGTYKPTPTGTKNARRYGKTSYKSHKEEISTTANAYLKKYGYSSIESLETAISDKKAYLKRTKYLQKGIKLQDDALKAEDFEKYAQKGAEIENPTFREAEGWANIFGWRPGSKEVGNIVTYSRDNANSIVIEEAEGPNRKGDYKYTYMTDDEVAIYNYYLAKEKEGLIPEGTADEYLESMEQTLENREAERVFQNLEGKTGAELLFGVAAGLDQFVSGFRNLFNTSDEYIPVSSTQVVSGMVREDLADNGAKFLGSSIGQMGYDVITTTSNMAPSILASAVTGSPAVGAVTLGASASGNAYQEMLNLGYSKGQARTYSTMVGISEAGLSYVLGGVSKMGGKLTNKGITKLADKVDNAIGRFAINYGGRMGAEFTEEYLQEVLTPVFKNIAVKSDEDVELFSSDALYNGFLGALSAGFLEGGSTISAEVNFQKQAKMYSDPDTIQGLIDTALTLPEGSEAFNLAKEYQQKIDSGKSLKKAEILNLVSANNQGIISEDTSKITAAVESRLSELGETNNVAQLSEIITKEVKGERLSLTENAILKNSRYAQRVINELNPENIASGEYSSSWAESIGTEKINTDAYNGELSQPADVSAKGIPTEPSRIASVPQEIAQEEKTISEGKLFTNTKKASESELGVSESGVTVLSETQEPIKIVEIAAIEDGNIKLKIESGEIVDASEVEFGSREEALIYEAATDMSAEVANDFVKGYNQLKEAPLDNRQSLETYLVGFKEAYGYGKYGIPYSSLERDGQYASSLSPEQRKIAYNRGGIDAANTAKSKQEALNKSKKKGKSLKGKIEYDEGIVGTLPDGEIRSESLKMLEFFNKNFAGADIRIFASYVDENGKRVYKNNRTGKVEAAPNGKYFQDGSLAIDLNAGNQGEGLILDTASHELTHRGKDFSPQKYKTYADLLFKHYGENNSVEELIQHEIDFAKSKGRTLSEEDAYHEAVARCSERMLVDCLNGTAQNFAQELYKTDKSLWNKIKQFFADLVAKIKALYSQYTPDSKAAQIVSEMQDVAEELQRAWLDMVVDSGQAYAALDKTLLDNGIVVDSESEAASLMSVRTLLDENQKQKVAKTLAERFDVTQKEAMEWLNAETSMASLILNPKYSQYLDYEADSDEDAIKTNSDYPQGTVDFSNICKKRRAFTDVMDRTLRNFPNHVFMATDLAKIRTIMEEEGMEVACAICYVEDRRQLDSIVAKDFINSLELYRNGSKTRPDGKPFNANQLKAMSLIEGDTYTPSIYELISLEGRNELKAKNPAMDSAWVKFNNARGMQSVRLLLNEAEYKRQILKYNKNTVNSKNNHGGLRVYSFSDMEMFHLIDIIQVISDSATVGLSLQGYTKVNEYAKAVKDTGEKLNRSLIPKGDLGYHIEDGRIVLDFDTVEGIDINHKDFFDNSDNPDVGNIVIGINKTQIRAAMTSKFIDQIIPFHTGQSNEVLGEKGIATWSNYKDFQTEKDLATGKTADHQINIYTEVIQAAEKEGKPITNKVEFVNKFLEVCRENNLEPRFSEFLDINEKGEYIYTEGYHKFLVDFKMFDQNTGEILPQKPVKPFFDNEYITQLLKDYVKSQKVKDAEIAEAMPKVIERITNEIIKPSSDSEAMLMDRDFSYSELVAKEDLQGVVIDRSRQVKLKPNGTIDIDWLMSKIKSDCSSVNTQAKFPTYYVSVPDIGRNVEITKDGVDHGIAPKNKPGKVSESALINARVSLDLPNILSNSIEVNRSRREGNLDAPYTHVMIGISAMENQDKTVDYYVVRMMVQERINQNPILVESNVLGKLYAVNAKKIDSSHAKVATNGRVARATKRLFGYSVADLLNDVNTIFDDTFSEDVYKHFGKKRETNKFSENLLYSDRDSNGNTLSKEQIEFFKDSKVRDENGNLLVVFHGTENGGFTIFDPKYSDDSISLFFASDEELGATYSDGVEDTITMPAKKTGLAKKLDTESKRKKSKGIKGLYPCYLNMENPLVVDAKGSYWNNIPFGNVKKMKTSMIDQGNNVVLKRDLEGNTEQKTFSKEEMRNALNRYDKAYAELVNSGIDNDGENFDILIEKAVENSKDNPILEYLFKYKDNPSETAFMLDIMRNALDSWEGSSTQGEARSTVLRDASFNTDTHEIENISTRDLAALAKKQGRDGVIINNVIDVGMSGKKNADFSTKSVYIAFNSEQVKSIENTNPTSDPDIRYSDRDPDSISNRNLLANALESAVQNDIERNKLQQYKEKIDLIEAEQKKLSELRSQIKDISFSKGKRDTVKLRKLQDEATRTANRITTYDRQLLNLEATTALKNVLTREKDLARKRQKQKDAEVLRAYKEKAAATQRKLLERAQESRMKAVEGRNKTQMRHKIQRVVSDLNQLLLNGSKDKHVMEGLQKAVATALNAINMDTVGADERVAKYNALIAKATDPDVIASLTETRDRIQAQGDKMSDKIAALKNAYNDIINSSDPSLVNAYDSVITNYIEHVAEKVGNTPLRDMNLEQLEAIHDMYKMVLTTVRNFNKAFKMAKSESISSLGNRVMMEVEEVGGSKSHVVGGKIGAVLDAVKTYDFNNLKPVYALERIGSSTLSRLYENVRQGEDVWAVDVSEAKEFKETVAKKYGYKKWDFDAVYNFETSTGKKYTLTLEQIMSLYAYSKRDQALPHLAEGGFVFDSNIETYKEKEKGKKSVLKYRVNTATAFKVSENEVGSIISKLTSEQKGFVDEMQDYLSTVMGAKGNEVSMDMYGIKLFKEKFYFPLKSAKQYMYEQNEVAGEVKIKNSGFSKGTVKHANNPVILSNFMDVWANHVNDMSMYHAFVLPLEDFNRVFNYNTPASESLDEESVKGFIQNAYGAQANQYVSQLLKDLNGGVRVDPRESIAKNMIGKFKKASVFGSLSVIIQQPSAIGRALALIDAKYFDFNPKLINHSKLWAEVKKYAPVAIIKEMGHFDTDTGTSTVDYIKGEETLMEKADDIIARPAAYMDELTWVHIWTAVKREVAAKNKGLKGEEYLQKCGERFTEIVTKTQVYDSILSRSANMRSKSVFMNMLTSFMAEPTTAINMLEDAIVKFKRGAKGKAVKQTAAVAASVILNAMLVSFVYAGRDDDEDETYWEKYAGSLTSETIDGFNPITYYPFLKDVWSIMQGYDVQRNDMTLVSKAVDSLKNAVSIMQTDTTNMTEEELAEHNQKVRDAWLGIAGDFSSLFGIPAKNIIRDVKAGFNVYNTAKRDQESSLSLIWDEVAESAKSTIPIVGWLSKESKSDKLYDVIMSGDSAHISRLKSGYKSETAYNSAVRKALKENDSRIREAAEARMSGDMTLYKQIVLEIKAEGNFSQDNIIASINNEITSLKSSDGSSGTSKSVPTFTTTDYFNAAANGDSADISAVKEYLIESGKTESQIASSLNSKVKDAYEKGEIDSTEAISIMTSYGDKTLDEANISVKYIDFKADYPDYVDMVTEDRYKRYTEPMPNFSGRSLEDTGMSVGVYAEYCEKSASCKGVDANGDGKADSGTKKAAVMQVINSLPLSNYQKDALYYLNGWSAGTIYEAPWH